MKYEKSVITMTLLRLGYVAHSLGNCVMTLPTETSLTPNVTVNHLEDSHEYFRSKKYFPVLSQLCTNIIKPQCIWQAMGKKYVN